MRAPARDGIHSGRARAPAVRVNYKVGGSVAGPSAVRFAGHDPAEHARCVTATCPGCPRELGRSGMLRSVATTCPAAGTALGLARCRLRPTSAYEAHRGTRAFDDDLDVWSSPGIGTERDRWARAECVRRHCSRCSRRRCPTLPGGGWLMLTVTCCDRGAPGATTTALFLSAASGGPATIPARRGVDQPRPRLAGDDAEPWAQVAVQGVPPKCERSTSLPGSG